MQAAKSKMKNHYRGNSLCNPTIPLRSMYLVKAQIQVSVYPRMAHMTVFALHPEAIILGWLLQRPRLLTGKLQYIKQKSSIQLRGRLM